MSEQRLVVVGASLAGLRAVEAARRSGYDGTITVIGEELEQPYDRPPLSKEFLTSDGPPTPTVLREEAMLRDELGVDLRLGVRATGIDVDARVVLTDGAPVPYDTAVLATGARPRTLADTDGIQGVHVLRTVGDARAIRAALDAGARTVVVGAGFIGSEIAASARTRGCDVTVVEALPTPLAGAVGEQTGLALAALHERNGTHLRLGVGVDSIEAGDHVERGGSAEAVRLADGTRLPADLVVVGIGVTPNVEWLSDSGIELGNGVECSETLETSAAGVYAAGDIASWPNPLFGTRMRLEHWTIAAEQGGHAGRNAASPNSAEPFSTVPYFWSDWYGKRIQFVGVAAGAEETRTVVGDLDSDAFLVLYRRGDRLAAALGLEQRSQVMKYRNLLANSANWDDALDFAAERAAAAAAKAAASAAG